MIFSSPTKAASKSEAAFTLMELAVVVAVAGLLLAIVVAAHATPRNRVYQITDVRNHRSIMQAMISFAGDNGDLMPNPAWGTVQKSWLYGTNLPVGGGGTFSAYLAIHSQQLVALTNAQLFSYLQDPRLFMCPADDPSDRIFWLRNVTLSSYVWNAAVNGYGRLFTANPSAYKLSQFRPDAILEWETDERNPSSFNDGSATPDESFSQRHGTNNFTFGMFGGGVATTTVKVFFTEAAMPAANRLWCNPGSPNGR